MELRKNEPSRKLGQIKKRGKKQEMKGEKGGRENQKTAIVYIMKEESVLLVQKHQCWKL